MNTFEIKTVAEKIEATLQIESNISISELIMKLTIRKEIVLIAIGYLLHEGRVYLSDNCQDVSYKQFYY